MNKDDLLALREVFRERMELEDFCIGQEQVEKLFRELLGEPEPVREYHPSHNVKMISSADVIEMFGKALLANNPFDRDDTFYKKLKK